MSEFLALLAIESHRTAAQRIEVAGSKGNASQTFANIGAVDLAWKKNGKQINNLFYPDKKKSVSGMKWRRNTSLTFRFDCRNNSKMCPCFVPFC